jgi:hypothetical protein
MKRFEKLSHTIHGCKYHYACQAIAPVLSFSRSKKMNGTLFIVPSDDHSQMALVFCLLIKNIHSGKK